MFSTTPSHKFLCSWNAAVQGLCYEPFIDMPECTVGVSIVTFNSSLYIRRCLDAVLAQHGLRLDLVVVDNCSTDATPEILNEYRGRIRIIRNRDNLGFAAAQNQAIRAARGRWVLTLNPDV